MEDHHVDRPEVQARQRVQLTGTNRSIGLIRSGNGKVRSRTKSLPDGQKQHKRFGNNGEMQVRVPQGRGIAVNPDVTPSRRNTGLPQNTRCPVGLRASCRSVAGQDTAAGHPPCNLGGVFPGLVVIARAKHPIPSRTRPLSAVAPMVLRLKTWESRSPPDLKRR